MKTTVDIPDKMLQEAMRNTKAKTKREAILTALDELNRRRAMAELVKFSGTAKELISVEELAQLRATDRPLPTKSRRKK